MHNMVIITAVRVRSSSGTRNSLTPLTMIYAAYMGSTISMAPSHGSSSERVMVTARTLMTVSIYICPNALAILIRPAAGNIVLASRQTR